MFAVTCSSRSAALFSYFLTPNAVGNAELLIGGIDDTKFEGRDQSLSLYVTLR